MKSDTLFRGAFVALCLIGMLVLPAAAAQNVQPSVMKSGSADQALKDDLWANHQQYRLQRFDLNVEQATAVISILDTYGIDTTACKATLASISGERSKLESALAARDRAALKTLNTELKTLWKQFRNEIRTSIREHYGGRAAGTTRSPLTSTDDAEDAVL